MRKMTFLLLVTTLLGVSAAALAGEKVQVDNVLHIKNGMTPAQGNRVVALDEVWRVGGDDGEDFFGMISQVCVGDDGLVYLLDTRLSEVPVYSADGERVNTLSREGEGPGETRTPSNLLFMPDGSLGLVQVFPGRIVKIQTDGTPAGEFQPGSADPTKGGFLTMFDCVANGENLVVAAESIKSAGPAAQDRTNYVASFDAEGNELVRFFEHTYQWDFTNFEYNEDGIGRVDFRRIAAGPDGRVYIATERNRYEIKVYLPDGTVERVIEREYAHYERTDEEYNRIKSITEGQMGRIPNARVVISRTDPDVGGLRFGPDGNLWVSTSRSGRDQPEGIMATWDVFTPDGEFVETVSAACEGDGTNDLLIWTADGAAVQVTGFVEAMRALQSGGSGGEDDDDDGEDAEPMEVVYWKIRG